MTNKSIKTRRGVVVSDKMDKTVIVKIDTVKTHPLYGKKYLRSKRYKADDQTNQFKVGDIVEIIETKPLSHDKKFIAQEVSAKENGKVK